MNVEDLVVFVAADYSQIEIRMLAEVTGDKLLISQFNSGVDIHCAVGKELTGWPEEQIAKDKAVRRSVKEFHFSIVYGVGKDSMHGHLNSKGVKITRKQSDRYYDRYFIRYSGVANFMKQARDQVERLGYVETLFGFRREIRQDDETRGSYWGNMAVNSPIQGTAHQLVLMAMAMIHLKPRTYNLLQTPVMEVHDALYFYVKLRDLPEAFKQIKNLLERDVVEYAAKRFKRRLRVPLLAEASAGFCLGSMIDYAGEPWQKFLPKWREKHLEIESRPLSSLMPEIKPV